MLMRETVVLGRTGEEPGRLVARTDVVGNGPVLVEEIDSAVLSKRVLDSILAIGYPAEGGMALEAGGTLYRALSDDTHSTGLDSTWSLLVSR